VAIYAEFIVRVLNQQVLQVIFKLLVLRKTWSFENRWIFNKTTRVILLILVFISIIMWVVVMLMLLLRYFFFFVMIHLWV
jgi:hypothetical protein